MKIEQSLIYAYQIPFVRPLPTAHGLIESRLGAFVGFRVGGTWGWGEIAPLPQFGTETLAEALEALARQPIAGSVALSPELLKELLTWKLPPSTQHGVELAILDLLAKLQARSVAEFLGGEEMLIRNKRVVVNAVVGAKELSDLLREVRLRVEEGYRCLKLKVGGSRVGGEIERVRAVRAVIGPDIHLRLDANEAWEFGQAREILQALEECQIQYIEQPLAADDIEGMERLHELVTIPLAVDEALLDVQSAEKMLASSGVDVLILKPQFLGGYQVCASLMERAKRQGKACVVTSALEAGIGVAGALWLAATQPDIMLESGLATLHMLEDDLIIETLQPQDGSISLPNGPGLGITLDQQALARYLL